jgi:hypothetical protein
MVAYALTISTKRNMQLLTKTLEKRFMEVGSQEMSKDPIVIAKYFNPTGAGTWYATEYYPENQIFFGYVSIFGDFCDEWGYFSLQELQDFKGRFDLGIERDLYCGEFSISEILHKKGGTCGCLG